MAFYDPMALLSEGWRYLNGTPESPVVQIPGMLPGGPVNPGGLFGQPPQQAAATPPQERTAAPPPAGLFVSGPGMPGRLDPPLRPEDVQPGGQVPEMTWERPPAAPQASGGAVEPPPATEPPPVPPRPPIQPPASGNTNQPSAMATAYESGGPGAARWESYQPAPDAFRPTIDAAAAKWAPEGQQQKFREVLSWLGYHESGWNPNAVGIPTSSGRAQGMFQFMPGTAKQFGIDPMDPHQSINGAAQYLRQLLDRNGGDWEKAVSQYGTFSTGQGSALDNSVRAGFQKFMAGIDGNSQPSPTLIATTNAMPSQNPLATGGLSNEDLQALMRMFGPTPSQQMAAMAAGLLRGKTFGESLGNAFEAQGNTQRQGQDFALKAALARAQLGNTAARLDQGQQRLNMQQTQGDARINTQNRNADTRAMSAEERARQNEWTRSGAPVHERQNAKDITDFSRQADAARENVQTISDLMAVLDKEGITGPDFMSRMKRYMSTAFGVDVAGITPSGVQLAEKDLAALRNGQLLSQTRGSIPRSNAELQALQAGFGQMQTNPAALKVILQRDLEASNRIIAANKAWGGMSPEERKAALAQNDGLFSSWRNQFTGALPQYQEVTGEQGSLPTPRVQQGPNGWQKTSSGVKWQIN